MRHTIHSNPTERGSILVYALLVITFLAGLASYLNAISSPVLFQMTDTQRILRTDYLNDSTSEIFTAVVCSKVSNTLEQSAIPQTIKPYKTTILKIDNENSYTITTSINGTVSSKSIDITTTIPVKKEKIWTRKSFSYHIIPEPHCSLQ